MTTMYEHLGDVPHSLQIISGLDAAAPKTAHAHDAYEYFVEKGSKNGTAQKPHQGSKKRQQVAAAPVPAPVASKKGSARERRSLRPASQGAAAAILAACADDEEVEETTERTSSGGGNGTGSSVAQLQQQQVAREHEGWLDERVRRTRALGACFRLGALVVHDFGRVAPLRYAGFHTAQRIFPIGYRATRIFWSTRQPLRRCVYVCEILDAATLRSDDSEVSNGARVEHTAVFRITPLDCPRDAIQQATPGACVRLLRAAAQACNASGAWRLPTSTHSILEFRWCL